MFEEGNIDGTPAARFDHLMAELGTRFPDPRPHDSAHAPEEHYIKVIDQMIADSRELREAKNQLLNLFTYNTPFPGEIK